MNSQFNSLQQSDFTEQHLEFGFGKSLLNTSCGSKCSAFEQKTDSAYKQSVLKLITRNSEIIHFQDQKPKPPKKQHGLNKKSRCFAKQISKVLKKNKLKNSTKTNPNDQDRSNQNQSNFDGDASTVRFQTNVSTKIAKSNNDIKKIINDDKTNRDLFNFEAFFQNEIRKSQEAFKLKFQTKKPPVPKRKNLHKTKTVFICDTQKNQNTQNLDPKTKDLADKLNYNPWETYQSLNQKFPKSEHPTFKNIFQPDEQFIVKEDTKFEAETMKNSRLNSHRQSINSHIQSLNSQRQTRRFDMEKKNRLQSAQLHRSLKRAMSNVSCKQSRIVSTKVVKIKTERAEPTSVKQQKQEPVNYAQQARQIHYDKLRSKIMSKMQDYKKINQMREIEERQTRSIQKKRTVSAQSKLILTVQGTNMTLIKQDNSSGNFKGKQFKNRRPYTALSRTGLQYDRRQSYKRRTSEKQYKNACLAGYNSSANHFRDYSKNAVRQIEQLDECKSQRVVRKLRQKYDTRPQTAVAKGNNSNNNNKKDKIMRPSTARTHTTNKQMSTQQFQRQLWSMNVGKVTTKTIEKQKMKQKLLGLLVECQEEKVENENLKQGLDIFEDYCDNVDEGLKNITKQINQFIIYDGAEGFYS